VVAAEEHDEEEKEGLEAFVYVLFIR